MPSTKTTARVRRKHLQLACPLDRIAIVRWIESVQDALPPGALALGNPPETDQRGLCQRNAASGVTSLSLVPVVRPVFSLTQPFVCVCKYLIYRLA